MNEFMKLAIEKAREGMFNGYGGPFGAVVVKGGKVLGSSCNTVVKEKDSTCHAEMNVIREACRVLGTFNLEGCDIYTTGKPCKMCEAAIGWAKIKRVYYGNTYEDALRSGFNEENSNSASIDMIRMDEHETVKLIDEWNSSSDRVFY